MKNNKYAEKSGVFKIEKTFEGMTENIATTNSGAKKDRARTTVIGNADKSPSRLSKLFISIAYEVSNVEIKSNFDNVAKFCRKSVLTKFFNSDTARSRF